MSVADRVVADPAALEALTREGREAVARAGGDVDAYRDAISRYACAPTDLPVAVREWTGDVEAALRALDRVDRGPAAFAAALRALDRRVGPRLELDVADGPGFEAALAAAEEAARVGAEVPPARLREVADDAVPWLSRVPGYDALDTVGDGVSAWALPGEAARGTAWRAARCRLEVAERWAATSHRDLVGNRAARRAQARELQRAGRARLRTARPAFDAIDDTVRSARTSMRPLARLGRGLGWVGVGASVVDTADAMGRRDVAGAVFSAAGGLGGALLLMTNPATAIPGAVLVGASLAYEYRAEIAGAGRWVGRQAGRAAGWAKDRLGGAKDLIGGLFGG